MSKQEFEDIEILYSADENYAPQLAASLLSLLDNSTINQHFIIHVIDNGLKQETKNKLENIYTNDSDKYVIYWEHLDEEIENLNLTTTFSKSSFGRLFIENIECGKKIIYIDCDMIVMSDLHLLWSMDMKENILAGVQDSVDSPFRSLIGLDESDRYINAGLLLINIEEWKKNNITIKCISYINEWNGNVPHNDQGVLNSVCNGKIMIISPEFNLQNPMIGMTLSQISKISRISNYYSHTEIINAKMNPVIIHFTEEYYNRPWNTPCTHPYQNEYWKYAKKIQWHDKAKHKTMSRNAKIMALVKNKMPFSCYLMLMRLISFRRLKKYGKRM